MRLDSATGAELPGRRRKARRAARANQDRAARHLRRHLDDGRLTLEEYTKRVEQASAAKTPRELAHVLREALDFPEPHDTDPPPDLPAGGEVDPADRTALARHLVAYLLAGGLLVMVWLVTGVVRDALGPFWPGWILLIWGVALLLHAGSIVVRAASRRLRAPPPGW